jgi:hypothetical protein
MLKWAPKLAWVAFFAALIAVSCASNGQQFPGGLLSTFVFAAVLTWLPRCRPVVETPLCPWNWALFVFSLQLVWLPLLITLDRPVSQVLPSLPSPVAINLAMVLSCLAFFVSCAVYNHLSRFQIVRPGVGHGTGDVREPTRSCELARYGSAGWQAAAALLGITGIFLSFGNIAGIIAYFNDPSFYRDYFWDASSTVRGLAAVLLKPFLGFTVIMTWCKWMDVDCEESSWLRRALPTILMLVGVVISFSFFSYNRGAFAVPLVAVAAVASAKGDTLSWRIIVTAGVLVFALLPAYAVYRSGTELGDTLLVQSDFSETLMNKVDVSDIVQMYGGAPQYLAFLLERTHWGRDPHWGAVTVSSILSPLPLLGKAFRQQSGFTLYNRLIYGTDEIADQDVPFVGETFLDFHVVGVVAGYAMLGWILYGLQRAFEKARLSLDRYIWQYLCIWICLMIFGSIGVTSQILIYLCWPIYAFWCRRKSPGIQCSSSENTPQLSL